MAFSIEGRYLGEVVVIRGTVYRDGRGVVCRDVSR